MHLKILPSPPLAKEGVSSLTKQQSVSPFCKGGLRGIYGQKNPPQPFFNKGGGIIANKTTECLPLFQRGTKGDLWELL